MIAWSFKILITIVLAPIYSFCFEDTVSLSIPIKRHNFCQTPLYNSGVTRSESWTYSHTFSVILARQDGEGNLERVYWAYAIDRPNVLQHCLMHSTPHSWRHKRACKALLDWNSDKQHALSLKNTLLESSLQKTSSPNFLCPCSRASSSRVQLHLDNRFLGNSNSPLIRTENESPGLTSYIYYKFNLENPKPGSKQCFVAPFPCISLMIPFTASDFTLCLSEIQSPNALRTSIFRQVCGALLTVPEKTATVYFTTIPCAPDTTNRHGLKKKAIYFGKLLTTF